MTINRPTNVLRVNASAPRQIIQSTKFNRCKPPLPLASNNERCTPENKVQPQPTSALLPDFIDLFSSKSPSEPADSKGTKPLAIAHDYAEMTAHWLGSVCTGIGDYVSDCIALTFNLEEEKCAINQTQLHALTCPVKASDGHIYEANDLLIWIHQCKRQGNPAISPLTRKRLTHVQPIPRLQNMGLLVISDSEYQQISAINDGLK